MVTLRHKRGQGAHTTGETTITMTSSDALTLYTIGHSDHTLEALIELLHGAGITALADVRSRPYSRWAPQANRETLARALEKAGISYVFLGDVLGGRPEDPALYPPGEAEAPAKLASRPDYAPLAATPAFQAGLEQLITEAGTGVVVVMCSEGDYHHCHRAALITPELLTRGVRVIHILPTGEMEEARIEPRQLHLF